jgi:hypothetical protein
MVIKSGRNVAGYQRPELQERREENPVRPCSQLASPVPREALVQGKRTRKEST